MFDVLLSDPVATEYYNQTVLHPIGMVAVLIFGTAMLIVPRRWALVPILLMACFVSPAQRLVVLGFDFNLMRMLVMAGWLRIVLHHEYKAWKWRLLDSAVCLWAVWSAIAFCLLRNDLGALVNRLGFLFDALGMYFLFRMLLRDWADLRLLASAAAILAIPVAGAFLIEKATARNMFAFLGGVPEITTVRAGVLRCQGAFAHPILAGAFWASLMPLIASTWLTNKGSARLLAPIGLIAAGTVVVTCASSTPLVAMIIGAGAVCLYPLRKYLSWMRLAIVVGAIALHMVMIAPLWHLLARISLVEGSTGWYRFKLIDEFFQHFNEWWLIGTESTAHWWKWGSADVTNQYVVEGVHGGLGALVLFIIVLAIAFYAVGRARKHAEHLPQRRFLAWCLGCSLLMHAMIFVSVAYFGQILMIWYVIMALAGSLWCPQRPMRISEIAQYCNRTGDPLGPPIPRPTPALVTSSAVLPVRAL